ncbi:MAG: hypothetical protein IPH11_10115 [Ignavibacteriales bacterium]|nr:hypothetical protein [Ignavibacteriales bacterium]
MNPQYYAFAAVLLIGVLFGSLFLVSELATLLGFQTLAHLSKINLISILAEEELLIIFREALALLIIKITTQPFLI